MSGISNSHPDSCQGCGSYIFDKFLLHVDNRSWHANCLKCQACGAALEGKCYRKDNAFYCKMDYFKRFGPRCKGCKEELCVDHTVRRAKDLIFHESCMRCAKCAKQVVTGDRIYKTSGDEIECETHRQDRPDEKGFIPSVETSSKAKCDSPGLQCQPRSNSAPELSAKKEVSFSFEESLSAISEVSQNEKSSFSADDLLEAQSDNIWDDISTELPKETAEDNPMKNNMADADSSTAEVTSIYDEGGGADENVGLTEAGFEMPCRLDQGEVVNSQSSTGKKRGPRTTIKAKQLDMLKSAFMESQKPNRHTREQLAKDTGLPMRVIQVWFQNRRSKERRLKQVNMYGTRRQMYSRLPQRHVQSGFLLRANDCQAPNINVLEPDLRGITGLYNYNDRAYTEKFDDGGQRPQFYCSRNEDLPNNPDSYFPATTNVKQENGEVSSNYFGERSYIQELSFRVNRVPFRDNPLPNPELYLQQSPADMSAGPTTYVSHH